MFRWCGCGPSDCQNWDVEGERRAGTPQPGFEEETVQEAREEISLRPEGGGGGKQARSERPAAPGRVIVSCFCDKF